MKRYIFTILGMEISLFYTGFDEKATLPCESARGSDVCFVYVSPSQTRDFSVRAYLPEGEKYSEPQLPLLAALFYFSKLRGLPLGSVELEYFGRYIDTSEYDVMGDLCAISVPSVRGVWREVELCGGVNIPCCDFLLHGGARGIFFERAENFDSALLRALRFRGESGFSNLTFAISEDEPHRIITSSRCIADRAVEVAAFACEMLRSRGAHGSKKLIFEDETEVSLEITDSPRLLFPVCYRVDL